MYRFAVATRPNTQKGFYPQNTRVEAFLIAIIILPTPTPTHSWPSWSCRERVALFATVIRLVGAKVIVPYNFAFSHDISSVKLMFVYDIIFVNDVMLVPYNVFVPDYLLRTRAVKYFPFNWVMCAVTATACTCACHGLPPFLCFWQSSCLRKQSMLVI